MTVRQRKLFFTILLISFAITPEAHSQAAKDLKCRECVDGADLKPNAVTAVKIKNNSVVTSKIKNNAVTGPKIKNSAVTASKIKNNAVTTSKIKNNAVTASKIKNSAVTEQKIKNGAVTGAKISNGTIDSTKLSQDLRNKINDASELKSSHNSLASRLSSIEDSSLAEDKFNYRYERNERMAGEVFSIGDREYEMAEFDVVSLLDHSIFTIKLPVQISSFAEETYPRYGLKVTIHGEINNWQGAGNTTISDYPANVSYHTNVDYQSEAINTSSSLKPDFDADGQLTRATIYPTYLWAYKDNTRVRCIAPSIDFTALPANLSHASLNIANSTMSVYYSDGSPYESNAPIRSEFLELIGDCVNSDSYLRQNYSVETEVVVSATINLDKETYFSVYARQSVPTTPSTEVFDYDRSFIGTVDLANEVPNADDRHLERQRIWQLLDNIVITKY